MEDDKTSVMETEDPLPLLPPPPSRPHEIPQDFKDATSEIAQMFGIQAPRSDREIEKFLKALTNLVERKLEKQPEGSIQAGNLLDFPLGFQTGDNRLDAAARVLRILYINDLKDVQNEINSVLTYAQNYTADPKTSTI